MKTRLALALGFAFLLISPADAQSNTFRMMMQAPRAMGVVTGQPYSYEAVSENKQTLADGTHISQPTLTTKMFRDSAGRMRTERPMYSGYSVPPNAPWLVEIYDAVAGYRYVLDPVAKVAHRSALPPQPQQSRGVVSGAGMVGSPGSATAAVARPAAPNAADAPPRPEYSSESLGTKAIDGLTCEGRLMKTTYPVGAMGNDRPLITTNETWFSTELKMMLLSKYIDPRNGDRTMTTKNFSRVEPEYSLFQPPPDYKIVDETGSFEISIRLP